MPSSTPTGTANPGTKGGKPVAYGGGTPASSPIPPKVVSAANCEPCDAVHRNAGLANDPAFPTDAQGGVSPVGVCASKDPSGINCAFDLEPLSTNRAAASRAQRRRLTREITTVPLPMFRPQNSTECRQPNRTIWTTAAEHFAEIKINCGKNAF